MAVIDNKISLYTDKSDLIIVNYYYATMNNFIKFKITTKEKWLQTLNRAKNKTKFEEYVKKKKSIIISFSLKVSMARVTPTVRNIYTKKC